jgi:hypothetical protein
MFVWREGKELEATRPIRYFSANVYHLGQSETTKSLKCTTLRKKSDKEKPCDAQEHREYIHTFYSRSRNNLRLPARHKQISKSHTTPISRQPSVGLAVGSRRSERIPRTSPHSLATQRWAHVRNRQRIPSHWPGPLNKHASNANQS